MSHRAPSPHPHRTPGGVLWRGVVAGAVGTLVLDAATYGDMALTGRAASSVPADAARALVGRLDLPLPQGGSRPEAYGALLGLATGVTTGVAAAVVRAAGVRLPAPVSAVLVGAGAMAASDLGAARLGVSDPATWSTRDWVGDAVPHALFGVAVVSTLRRLDRAPSDDGADDEPAMTHRRAPLALRALALGLAAGSRSSLGAVALARATGGRLPALAAATAVVGEVVADKLPQVPSRLEAGPLLGRLGAGALGAAALARREHAGLAGTVVTAALAAGGAFAGAALGTAARSVAQERGWSAPAAVAEDVTAGALALWAVR
ncbi:hypothetical protein [Lapillicoccus jejuensis]|uniref:DUF4126 domain-containing protein n=1 Tax=Lapillicoccus jejuensis TaxID=402171 RepID=A0A542E236_9MICO|nr:hypothetical protein [Lapillicoccus jejuensis]TQJ09329.1 hypothetical protein FB458_2439 [Lapillicoccus jejuensis]